MRQVEHSLHLGGAAHDRQSETVAPRSLPDIHERLKPERAGAAWSEWSSEPEQFIDAGDSVVVVVRMKAKGAGSGLELDRQDAQVYRFRDNKILRLDYYNS